MNLRVKIQFILAQGKFIKTKRLGLSNITNYIILSLFFGCAGGGWFGPS